MCIASVADAADLPSYTPKKVVTAIRKAPKPQKPVAKPQRKAVAKPTIVKSTIVKPTATKPVSNAPQVAVVPDDLDMNLVWVLDPLVANSDGPKREDSASVEANLIVVEPGQVSQSTMAIELTGHIVKTARTTARLDIQIGGSYRTVAWTSDEVRAEKFTISLNEPMKAGELPGYFPVSALAFVTKESKEGAAMVSLEKVTVRVGKVKHLAKKKDPATAEVTGSISTN